MFYMIHEPIQYHGFDLIRSEFHPGRNEYRLDRWIVVIDAAADNRFEFRIRNQTSERQVRCKLPVYLYLLLVPRVSIDLNIDGRVSLQKGVIDDGLPHGSEPAESRSKSIAIPSKD